MRLPGLGLSDLSFSGQKHVDLGCNCYNGDDSSLKKHFSSKLNGPPSAHTARNNVGQP